MRFKKTTMNRIFSIRFTWLFVLITVITLTLLGVRYYFNYQAIVNDQRLIQTFHQALLKETRARLFQLEAVADDRLLGQELLAAYHPSKLPDLTATTDVAYQMFSNSLDGNAYKEDWQRAWQEISFYRQNDVTCHTQDECSFIAENLNNAFISIQNKLLTRADFRFRQIPFIDAKLVQLTQLQSHINRWYVVSEHLAYSAFMMAVSPSDMWQESIETNLTRWQTHQGLMQDLVQYEYNEAVNKWVDQWRIQQTQMAFQVDAVLGNRGSVSSDDLIIRQLNRYQNLHGQLLELVVLNRTNMMTGLRASMIKNVALFGVLFVFLIFLILVLLLQARINRQDQLKKQDEDQAFLESGEVATLLLDQTGRVVKFNKVAQSYLNLDDSATGQLITRWMPSFDEQARQLALDSYQVSFTDGLGNQVEYITQLQEYRGKTSLLNLLKLKKPTDTLLSQQMQDQINVIKSAFSLVSRAFKHSQADQADLQHWLDDAIQSIDVESVWLVELDQQQDVNYTLMASAISAETELTTSQIDSGIRQILAGSWFNSHLKNNRILLSNNIKRDPRWAELSEQFPALQNLLCFPLVENNKLLGLLGFCNQKYGFNEQWIMANSVMQETALLMLGCEQQQVVLDQDAPEESTLAKSAVRSITHQADFLANMSHEIRTPMNGILGMTHLALKTNLDAQQQDYIHKIKRSASHLLSILNDILDISKIESGNLSIESIPIWVEEVIEDALVSVQTQAQDKRLELIVYIDQAINHCAQPSLKGDPVRISQILINLLSNAVKFTASGYVEIQVDLMQQEPSQWWVLFKVSDTGKGMTPSQLSQLFESYNQTDDSVARNYGGTGLGLAISKRLAQQMGGDLTVSSVVNQGSQFSLTLPLVLDAVPTNKVCPQWQEQIIIVDDNPVALKQLQALVVGFGFTCHSFNSASALLAEIDQFDPRQVTKILVDYVMPEIDGVELIEQIIAHNPAWQSRCVLASFYELDRLQQIARDKNILQVIHKPIMPSTFVALFSNETTDHDSAPKHARDLVPNLSTKKILLVEDNLLNQQIALELLKPTLIDVTLAENGEQAVNFVCHAGLKFDLVLMDVQMPIMNGIEATKQIRGQFAKAELPIIAMTAHVMSEEVAAFAEVGMNDHLAKPILPDVLYALLASYLAETKDQNQALLTHYEQDKQAMPNLDTIPGTDFASARAMMPPTPGFFENILKDVVHTYQDAPDLLMTMLTANQLDEALRYVHTFKGLSASVGLVELSKLLGQGEDLLLNQTWPSNDYFDQLKQLHIVLWQQLALALDCAEQTQVNPSSENVSVENLTDQQASQMVAKLQTLLSDFDAAAVDFWFDNHALFSSVIEAKDIASLDAAIKDFDFDQAVLLLSQLKFDPA
ncbi:response regulator [Thiomicrospira sp. ALE5]|uniref:response regulator n=1 Tax=Thiomicrospira sp. ALE5 TaxID=748650 RepID=UPI0008EFF53C|nr:response regulator [Thiomicrospira sp. ALE5]SFR56063.1 Signal transduction histidine kinase [Thiomicrospira sp. ALE5]